MGIWEELFAHSRDFTENHPGRGGIEVVLGCSAQAEL